MAYTAVHVDDVEPQRGVIRFMRRELGTTAFGINQFDLPPGAEGLEHSHEDSGQEEVYVILAGSGVMRIDGDEVPLRKGLNQLALTLSNTRGTNHGGWAFAFQATAPDGRALVPRAE